MRHSATSRDVLRGTPLHPRVLQGTPGARSVARPRDSLVGPWSLRGGQRDHGHSAADLRGSSDSPWT